MRYRVLQTEMNRCYYRVIRLADDMSAVQAHAYARGVATGLVQAGWDRIVASFPAVRDPQGTEWHIQAFDYLPGDRYDELQFRDDQGYELDEHGQRIEPSMTPDRELERRLLKHRSGVRQ
jgi:hypothetical protein